jgi:SSS family solute:Na+ symporter
MAALTAALMSTVDTLLNAIAAIYINDVHRPVKKWFKKKSLSWKEEDRQELLAARIATVVFTTLGVVAVIPFSAFPTVYEAHGYFHSTLTPPLVVAIFLGVFWKKFTNAAVISTFVGGVALMILGMYYPVPLIQLFDHGTAYDPAHPYTYIGALYNLFVCTLVAVLTTITAAQQKKFVETIKKRTNHKIIMLGITFLAGAIFTMIVFNVASMPVLLILTFVMIFLVIISSNYYMKYDESTHTEGLTVWSLAKAKEMFKGSKVNEREGKRITVKWELKDGKDDTMEFSKRDMNRMSAETGDLVYVSDARRYLGGLKSAHSTYGEPHNEDGIIYITKEQLEQGQFVKERILIAEKEM